MIRCGGSQLDEYFRRCDFADPLRVRKFVSAKIRTLSWLIDISD